jgi:hypothetical protein
MKWILDLLNAKYENRAIDAIYHGVVCFVLLILIIWTVMFILALAFSLYIWAVKMTQSFNGMLLLTSILVVGVMSLVWYAWNLWSSRK